MCGARNRRHFVWICMLDRGHPGLHDYAGSRWGEKDTL